jgi:hypothetical protein
MNSPVLTQCFLHSTFSVTVLRDFIEAAELVTDASVCSHSWHSSLIMYHFSPREVTAWCNINQNVECGFWPQFNIML